MRSENSQSNDPLAERLRREAMRERPAFSLELHREILERARDRRRIVERPRPIMPARWRAVVTAAAAILASIGLTVLWEGHWERSATNKLALDAGAATTQANAGAGSAILSKFNVGGVVSGRLWLPEITVELPIPFGAVSRKVEEGATQVEPIAEAADAPDWVISKLLDPARSAEAALNDVVPPEVRGLLGLVKE